MKTFALLVYPDNIKQIRSFWPITRIMPDFLIKSCLKKLSPFRISRIKSLRSSQGREIQGYLIACHLLPEQMAQLDKEFILDKIIAAGKIAGRLGASILGLIGFTSIATDNEREITKGLKIPVNCGSALTAWSVFEAIYRTAKTKNIDLKKSSLAVIRASDAVGSLCARKLSEYVSKIIITDRHGDKLIRLKEAIQHLSPIEIIIEDDVHKAVKDADIVIITEIPDSVLDINEFKGGAIVCDLSISKSITKKVNKSHHAHFIEGGLIKLPYTAKIGKNLGLLKNIVTAPMAETMLLTFAERFVSYSLGDNINLDKLEEIADLAVQHGFEVWVPEAPVV